jgi:hypothetical protein
MNMLITAMAMLACAFNYSSAQDRGMFQSWEVDYTANELVKDCEQKSDKCYFFIRTLAQRFAPPQCFIGGRSVMHRVPTCYRFKIA